MKAAFRSWFIADDGWNELQKSGDSNSRKQIVQLSSRSISAGNLVFRLNKRDVRCGTQAAPSQGGCRVHPAPGPEAFHPWGTYLLLADAAEVPGNLFCFSHCFRGKYETAIQVGLSDEVARRVVVGELLTYVGHVFEDVCRQCFLWEVREGRLDVPPLEVGRWWGTNPVERCEEEIDIVLSGVDG